MAEHNDMTFVREVTQKIAGITSQQMHAHYHMYFDETNNFKRVKINENRQIIRTLNIDNIREHFILGGIATKDDEKPISLEELKNIVNIHQKNIKEIKSANIYKGDFLNILKSKKLTPILNFLYDKHWFIHFSDVNLLYYSIVDIVDSLLFNSIYSQYIWNPEIFFGVKNEFYRIFNYQLSENLAKLFQFEYPDVKKEHLHEFKMFILEMTIKYYRAGHSFNHFTELLIKVLEDSMSHQRDLVFVQDEQKGILIDDFIQFYTTRLCSLEKSNLTLDNEGDIVTYLQANPLYMDQKQLLNYQFVDSKSNTFIQLSDILVGIISRYLIFADAELTKLYNKLESLDEYSLENLCLLNDILLYSEAENKLFFNQIERVEVIHNFWNIVNKYNNKN